jgi:hypothetical protein
MCQADSEQDWYKLTPDNTGGYVNGTWTRLASLQPGYIPATTILPTIFVYAYGSLNRAPLLVRFDHIARFIVNANHSIM